MIDEKNQQKEIKRKIGWSEFITNKDAMLEAYEKAKKQGVNRPTQTDKGKAAEAAVRNWLSKFLPKKFDVTSGYIISQGNKGGEKLLHYDVIIYDAYNSPILWIEDNPDNSKQGKVKAIPAEYVYAVLEVKSTLNEASCREAKAKLWELEPLLVKTDLPNEYYKQYLPPEFCMGIIFFEVLQKDKANIKFLKELIPEKFTEDLRGYFGGVVLKAEGKNTDSTGRISFLISSDEKPIPEFGDLMSATMCGNLKTKDNHYFSASLIWSEIAFANFAFDLLALMNGKYNNGRVSSFYGFPFGIATS